MNTYTPVVSCNTVRLMLILTCIHNLKSQSFDFLDALFQAGTKKDNIVSINTPTYFESVNG